MPITLVEITKDSEVGMICAGYVRLESFTSREEFERSNFEPCLPPPYRATSGTTFDVWADDPQFKRTAVLYSYLCGACGHRGGTHLADDSHDGAAAECYLCGAAVALEWDGGVTYRALEGD